jgi:RND superfamily putative drug exporter
VTRSTTWSLGPISRLSSNGSTISGGSVSLIGRLGRFAATHRRRVFIAWAVIAVGLGALAPRVETALSGAGWQANGSDSSSAAPQRSPWSGWRCRCSA